MAKAKSKKKMPAWLLAKFQAKLERERNVNLAGHKLAPGKTRGKILRRTRRAVQSVVPGAKHGIVRFNPPTTVIARDNPTRSKSHGRTPRPTKARRSMFDVRWLVG